MADEPDPLMPYAERIARVFYERQQVAMAEADGRRTVHPWEEAEEGDRELLITAVHSMVEDGVIGPEKDEAAPGPRDPLQELLDAHADRKTGRRRQDPVTTVVLMTITEGNKVAAVDQRSLSYGPDPA